jgi:hypothetical protein
MSVKLVSFYDTQILEESNVKETKIKETKGNETKDINEDNIQFTIEDEYESEPVPLPKPILKRSNPKIKRGEKNVSYDDILNSLGFGVNNMGLYKKNNSETQQYNQPNYQYQGNEVNYPINQIQPNYQYQSLDPRIKNSAIYNKYFKNYKDPNEIKVPQKPLTPQELRIKIIKHNIEVQQAKKRLSQIKSKKMFYSTQNVAISTNHNQPPVNLNKLFMFSNR